MEEQSDYFAEYAKELNREGDNSDGDQEGHSREKEASSAEENEYNLTKMKKDHSFGEHYYDGEEQKDSGDSLGEDEDESECENTYNEKEATSKNKEISEGNNYATQGKTTCLRRKRMHRVPRKTRIPVLPRRATNTPLRKTEKPLRR